MLKLLSVTFLTALCLQGNFAANVHILPENDYIDNQIIGLDSRKISATWGEHVKDFAELIDVDKVMDVVMGYLTDPEVLNFVTFVFSKEFKDIIWEFETMTEFKEAFVFLADKGYDVDTAINFINTALDLPPFEKPKSTISKTGSVIVRGSGVTGVIEDVLATLPLEEMKDLFESKLESSPEVAELFETINSPEFMAIMKKMSKNPKFINIKETFAGYGFDFKFLCTMAKEILGEYYQGVFCEN